MKKAVFLFLLFTLGLAGCGSSNSSSSNNSNNDYYNGSYSNSSSYSGNSSNSNTQKTPKQRVIDYVKANGSTSYYFVSTGSNTNLGYDSKYDEFIIAFTDSNSLDVTALYTFSYQAVYGSGMFKIEDSGTTMFEAYIDVYFSNHSYNNSSLNSISVNRYSSSANEYIAALIVLSAKNAANNCATFLSSAGLPYIF